jgi:hypothetical protein
MTQVLRFVSTNVAGQLTQALCKVLALVEVRSSLELLAKLEIEATAGIP